ncbi:MAG: GNAT family N-acetyltransferase [Desulfuromonadales bacterium]|nr:GNAT family N-acetyltransferase [Desulfuromonadales bacterium]
MRITLVKDTEEFLKIKEAWQALCDDLEDSITAFASFEWYETWWRHYSGGATLHMITMWDADRLVGIAPLVLRRVTIHGLPLTALCFMENNQSLNNDFIVAPAARELFFQELLRHLFSQTALWDVIVFRNIPDISINIGALAKTLGETGKKWLKSPTWFDSPYLVPSGAWADYLASRTARTRKSLRKIRNGILKSGDVLVTNFRTPEEFLSVKDEVFNVARQSWSEDRGDSMASPANEAFFSDLGCAFAQKGWLFLWTLRLNGTMVAIELHVKAFAKEHAMRSHYLPKFATLSPGTYLEMQIIKHAFEETEKVRVYDFCGSFEQYKRKWTDTFVAHHNILIFNERLYSRLIRFHEAIAVPLLRRVFPRNFWNSRIFRICGIKTDRMSSNE